MNKKQVVNFGKVNLATITERHCYKIYNHATKHPKVGLTLLINLQICDIQKSRLHNIHM